MRRLAWRVLGIAIALVWAAPSMARTEQARPDWDNLFDKHEWAVRKTVSIDLDGQSNRATAILLRSRSPKGESGTGAPLDGIEMIIVSEAHDVLYRFSYDQDRNDPDFFVDDTLEARDVTGDGVPELLFHSGVAGASDWTTHEHVIRVLPDKSSASDIAPSEFIHSWRHTFRWISLAGETLAMVADPLSPQNGDDPHACHGCPKFYQYLAYKWAPGRETFVLLESIQSTKDFDANTDPLVADMAFIRERLSGRSR